MLGVALWIGSFAVIGYLLKILTKNKGLKDFSVIIKRMQKWIMVGVLPSLLLIFLSGTYMIFQFNRDTMPFYLSIMEQGGTLIILLTILFVSIYNVKLTKKLKGIQLKKDKSLAQITNIYTNFLLISTLLAIGIIVVVGLRIV